MPEKKRWGRKRQKSRLGWSKYTILQEVCGPHISQEGCSVGKAVVDCDLVVLRQELPDNSSNTNTLMMVQLIVKAVATRRTK